MPAITHLRAHDYRVMPWKNGKGTTTELAVGAAPGDAAGAPFAWRLSLAEVPESGAFSDFAGYERSILMVEGEGMTLDFGPQGRAEVTRLFEPVGFSGDWATRCRLHGGPLRDLNLMVARDRVSAEVEVLRLGETAGERRATRDKNADILLCHLLAGSADLVLDEGAARRLECPETLLVEAKGAACPALTAGLPEGAREDTGEAVLFLAWLRFRRP